jgi:hypothetical protein
MEAQTPLGLEILLTILILAGPGAHLTSLTLSAGLFLGVKLAVCGVATPLAICSKGQELV